MPRIDEIGEFDVQLRFTRGKKKKKEVNASRHIVHPGFGLGLGWDGIVWMEWKPGGTTVEIW